MFPSAPHWIKPSRLESEGTFWGLGGVVFTKDSSLGAAVKSTSFARRTLQTTENIQAEDVYCHLHCKRWKTGSTAEGSYIT